VYWWGEMKVGVLKWGMVVRKKKGENTGGILGMVD